MASMSFITAEKLSELLHIADSKKSMYVRILSSTRLVLGADPLKPTTVIDLAREKVFPFTSEEKGTAEQPEPRNVASQIIDVPAFRTQRRSGQYWFELNGNRVGSRSLKEVLSGGLLALEEAIPGTLEKLSHIKPRSRRIVARDPNHLFDKAHLAKEYAEKLRDGWFFGTNNSANETSAWLQRACSCAGLTWGKEFKTSLAPTLDDLQAILS